MTTFDLDYLVDNGRLRGWLTDHVLGCRLVRWTADDTFSVLGPDGKPLGHGDTKEDALSDARRIMTDRRRKADGIIPARVC